ncbi:dihydropteroate synthase [Streptomyces mirabilis]
MVTDVVDEPRLRIEAASQAGIRPGRLIIAPGLGFAKESGHNGELLGRLGDIVALGRPVLVGASRKSFLGRLLADPVTGQPRPARLRDAATTAVSVLAAAQGAWCLRVHDVASTHDAVRRHRQVRRHVQVRRRLQVRRRRRRRARPYPTPRAPPPAVPSARASPPVRAAAAGRRRRCRAARPPR